MKTRNKLILAASCLLVLSGVATGTGTFAWYTATRVNQVTFQSKAYSTSTGIALVLDASRSDAVVARDGTDAGDDAAHPFALTSTKKITDTSYSGFGGTAHKPSVDSHDNAKANGWFTTDTASSYIHKFTFLVKSTGVSNVNLYLSPTSTLVASKTTENAALRFSTVYTPVTAYTNDTTFEGDDGAAALRSYAAPNSNVAPYSNYKYLTGTDTLSASATADLSGLAATSVDSEGSTTSKKIIDTASFWKSGARNYLKSELNAAGTLDLAGTSNVGYLATLYPSATDGTQAALITFYVWVEGTVTTNNVTDYTLTANFNFYTLVA